MVLVLMSLFVFSSLSRRVSFSQHFPPCVLRDAFRLFFYYNVDVLFSFFNLFPGVSIFVREGSEANQGCQFRCFFDLSSARELVGAWVYRAKQMDDPEGEGRRLFAPVQLYYK